DIPKRHFHTTYAARLARRAAKLPDFFENPLYITWIFTEDTAFQEQCITHIRSVTDFSQSVNPLVRLDTNDGRAAHYRCYAITQVGYPQIRRCRTAVYPRRGVGQCVFDRHAHKTAD